MKMVKVKTADLEGKALDWAVAKAVCPQSFRDSCNSDGLPYWSEGWLNNGSPSSDWAQCGPLIDEYGIGILGPEPDDESDAIAAGINWYGDDGSYGEGPTVQIAACRALVAHTFGDEVEVPEVLLK